MDAVDADRECRDRRFCEIRVSAVAGEGSEELTQHAGACSSSSHHWEGGSLRVEADDEVVVADMRVKRKGGQWLSPPTKSTFSRSQRAH